MIDIASTFDDVCQELGHSFGLNHEVDAQGNEYASPYSAMSARAASAGPEFLRPEDPRLPDGIPSTINDPTDRFAGLPVARIVGPALPAAQLYAQPAFRDSPSVIHISPGYAQQPVRTKLYALNYQVETPPGPLPVLAAIPSNTGGQRMFMVELRRGGFGYDAGIGTNSGPPAGLVVHSINPDGRVRYDGVAALELAFKFAGWDCVPGAFSLRYVDVDPAAEFAEILITGGASQNAGILWRTTDGGAMQIWSMNGAHVVGRADVVGETGALEHALPPWSIVAAY